MPHGPLGRVQLLTHRALHIGIQHYYSSHLGFGCVLREALKGRLPQTMGGGVGLLEVDHPKGLICFPSPCFNLSFHVSFGLSVLVTIQHTNDSGMDIGSYFLSFARLARRSALFWGHAVTSGISTFDGISKNAGRFTHRSGGSPIHGSSWETGGVDYFVSSWLFEDQDEGRLAQRKYSERCVSRTSKIVQLAKSRSAQLYTVGGAKSTTWHTSQLSQFCQPLCNETSNSHVTGVSTYTVPHPFQRPVHPCWIIPRLYLMQGLTTRFNRPPAPARGLVTRERLGIPPRHPLSKQPCTCCSGDTSATMDTRTAHTCNVGDVSGENLWDSIEDWWAGGMRVFEF